MSEFRISVKDGSLPRVRSVGSNGAFVLVSGLLVFVLTWAGCSNEEVHWETTTSAVGAQAAEEASLDERFRAYRVAVTGGLDVMSETLEGARRGVSVADRAEVDALSGRVVALRAEFVADVDQPSAGAGERRAELESSFDALRADVETFLLRSGHSADEFARWREIR